MKVYFEPSELTVFPVCSILTGNKIKADLRGKKKKKSVKELTTPEQVYKFTLQRHKRISVHIETCVLLFDRPLVCVCT